MKKKVLEILSKGGVKGLAHITGGGFTDNIPRVFPSGLRAKKFYWVMESASYLQLASTGKHKWPTRFNYDF